MGKKGKILDYQTIIRIKKLYEAGSSMREIKEETGLSLGTVFKYLNNDKEQNEIKCNKMQSGNHLEVLEKKIEQIENRLEQLEQKKYLLIGTPKPEKKEILPSTDEIQIIKNNGKIWIKSNEACKYVFKNDGSNCSDNTIKKAYTDWNKNTNQNKEGNFSYGYIIEYLLEALQYANETKDKRYHLNFSELERLTG